MTAPRRPNAARQIPGQRTRSARAPGIGRNDQQSHYRTTVCPDCQSKVRSLIDVTTLVPVVVDVDPDEGGGWVVLPASVGQWRIRRLDRGELPRPGMLIVREHHCRPAAPAAGPPPAGPVRSYGKCYATHCDEPGEPIMCARCSAELAAWRALPDDERRAVGPPPTSLSKSQRAAALLRSESAGTV